jgi:DNA-binding NtrC family response regulator
MEDVFRSLIGQSARMRHLVGMVEKVGPARWPVLLIGETGTGKEVVARRLHNANPAGPFVTIDCSSLVGPLMESELFGHAKGSFTGAHQAKMGLVEMANGGTAFFDEIGELPLDLQSKLLRVLQEKEFRPVGSLSPRRSDFRIIAATNRDLAAEVEKGTFRKDLYYRLNVVTLRLSPLRERRDDIPALVDHFLLAAGRGRYQLTPEILEAMIAYDWPGNVRELENCVHHLVAVNTGPLLHSHDLPSNIQSAIRSRHQGAAMAAGAGAAGTYAASAPGPVSPVGTMTLGGDQPVLPLAEVERMTILRAIQYTRGDRTAAAAMLGIGRTTLYRKLKEYGETVDAAG